MLSQFFTCSQVIFRTSGSFTSETFLFCLIDVPRIAQARCPVFRAAIVWAHQGPSNSFAFASWADHRSPPLERHTGSTAGAVRVAVSGLDRGALVVHLLIHD